MTVLQLDNIHKSYGAIKALNDVSFAVPKGAVFGLLGPNGSGKTTLLSIILDVLKADTGNFAWFGASPTPEQRKQIGTLLETPNFYHYLSATRNLQVTREISGRGSKEAIEEVLKKVQLYERRNSRFSTFSLGMKQRLAIGAALLGSPSVLVLDEPTNGLDPVGIAEIRELIQALNEKGHTIIMASHLLDEVEKICTHVAILKKGKLMSCGPVSEVLANEDQVEVSADNLDTLASVVAQIPGILHHRTDKQLMVLNFTHNTANLETINSFCFSKGIVLNHLNLRKQRLEARFFELTQN